MKRIKRKRQRQLTKPTEEILIQVDGTTRFRIHLYKKHGKGRLYNFIYQLETFHDGGWKPVVRYNNFHGFIHKDIFDKDGNRIKREIFGKISIREGTKIADRDLKANHKKYIKEFLESE